MLTHEENMRLCRVAGDAPMGRLMRRSWIPLCLSEEVEEPGGRPLRVTVFGMTLAVWRDPDGKLGAIDDRCPHRKASMAFGRNEEGGLRCLYHGWKINAQGQVVEMPSEPPETCAAARIVHPHYPVEEAGGFIWGYLGEPEHMPAFEPPPFAPHPGVKVATCKVYVPCNWAQILEGQIDSAHSSSLHSSDMVPARVGRAGATKKNWTRPSTDKAPRLTVQTTPYGFRYAAIRRPITNAATHDYYRITTFVSPLICLIPPNASYNVAQVTVPITDTESWFYFLAWGEGPDVPSNEEWRAFLHVRPGIDLDHRWRKIRTLDNDFLQDRQAMALGNFTGIKGIPNQDMAMWESQGPIADRTSERLGASDIAITHWRRLMLQQLEEFERGIPPLGHRQPKIPQHKIASFEGIVPKGTDWRLLGVGEEEAALYTRSDAAD
jgi:phthalate 4,5-dioxygenase oxygenase subunit